VDGPGSGPEIDEQERISRFLLDKREIDRATSSARPRAFDPWYSRERSRFECSVSRTQSLSEKAIWDIGAGVAHERDKTLMGRADISVSRVRTLGLSVDPDEPPPHHACILGWPEGDDPEAKADRRLLAEQLAAAALLVLVLRAA
jgi:hypothetical protein